MGMGKEGKPPSAAPAEKVVEANGEAGAGNHRKQVSFSDEGPAANDVKIDLKLDDDSKSTNGSSNGSVRSRQLSGKRSFDEMRSASMKRLGTLSEQFTVKFDLSCSVTVTLPSNFMADAYNRVVKKTQPGPKVFDKQVLQNVKGTALPGEFLVLLGPSGSGKTTLIQLLCGRVGPKYHTEGSLTYNDRALTKSIRRKVGFVMQDDVLYQALTVWETLFYAAVLRMPSSVPIADKKKRVSELISLLGLERCAQSTIGGGNAFRGISGGERRRVSIGVELVIDPAVLFLDEATSGLDSTIALRVFEVLKDLATMGRTVVSSLHQPSSRMFSAMDKILLLGKGHRLYYGDSAEVLSTMESYGYTPEFQSNPADFLLDLASEEESIKDIAAAEAERCKKADGDEILEITTVERNDSTASAASTASTTAAHTYPVSYMEQMYWLFLRSFNSRRAESVGYLFIITTSFSTLIMSVLWWDPSPTNPQTSARLEDILGLLFFAQIFWTFQPLFQALGSFPFDKLVLLKERSAGMYPLSAFFLARSFADIPLALGVPTACTAVYYWLTGLNRPFEAFIGHLGFILVGVLTAQSLGVAISCLFMDYRKAVTMSSLIVLTSIMAGGFYTSDTPAFMSWLRYVFFPSYTYAGLVRVETNGRLYLEPDGTLAGFDDVTSRPFVPFFNIPVCIGMLLGQMLLLRLLGYYFLRRST
mmetsp:Transcript_5466/g.19943  ORF Transcript_5466/g.19943 Transcript_5466/m.19943 type:complete len:701 (-) Transcript_5466:141-2243(-)